MSIGYGITLTYSRRDMLQRIWKWIKGLFSVISAIEPEIDKAQEIAKKISGKK